MTATVMTETPAASGGSRLATAASSWLDYLATPTPVSPSVDLPSPDRLVMVAVLDDGTSVDLGAAQHFPLSKVFRLAEGSLEVPEITLGVDGIYNTDSGRYRIMTVEAHATHKREESARVAVTLPAPKPPVVPPMPALANLTLASAPIGCGMHAKMATVIAIGPKHVEAAMKRTRAIADVAKGNNNVVTTVVVGVATEADALTALGVPQPRIFLAGANELKMLRTGAYASGAMRSYLREAVLIGLVPGSRKGTDEAGTGGAWLLPASPVPFDGSIAALEARGNDSAVTWQRKINTQWQDWFRRYADSSDELDGADTALLRAYTNFPVTPRHPPLAGLPDVSVALIGVIDGPPFGAVDHTVVWARGRQTNQLWPVPIERWAHTGTPRVDASTYWGIASWCHNTQQALRTQPPASDAQVSFDELQYDVLTTLATLLTHTKRLETLRGVLGPVVLAGRGGNEPMRVSWWTLPADPDKASILVLLPQAYVHEVVPDYSHQVRAQHGAAVLCSAGMLSLSNADVLPIVLKDVLEVELDTERKAFGARIWVLRAQSDRSLEAALVDVTQAPQTRFGLVAYRTQADVDAERERGLLCPGQQLATNAERTIFYTSTSSEDQLSGLRVRWSVVDARPVLDVDTYEGGRQWSYERFA